METPGLSFAGARSSPNIAQGYNIAPFILLF